MKTRVLEKQNFIQRNKLRLAILLVGTLLALSLAIGILATQSTTKQAEAFNAPLRGYNIHTMQAPNTNTWIDNTVHTYKLGNLAVEDSWMFGLRFSVRVSGGTSNGEGRHIQLVRMWGHITDWNVIHHRLHNGHFETDCRAHSYGTYPDLYLSINRIAGTWTYVFLFFELDENQNNQNEFPVINPINIYNNVVHMSFGDFWLFPPDPTPPAGHFFTGWYMDSALTIPYSGQPITWDTNFFARFSPIYFTIQYITFGGNVNLVGQPMRFNITTPTITLPTPTFNGFIFRGWYINDSFTGSAVTTIPTGSTGNRVFYARWEEEPPVLFTVRFYVGGTLHYEMQVPSGTVLGVKYTFTANGLAVDLFLDEDKQEVFSLDNAITTDLELFALEPFEVINGGGADTTDPSDTGEYEEEERISGWIIAVSIIGGLVALAFIIWLVSVLVNVLKGTSGMGGKRRRRR